ncbi:MAG: tetratricopeptide repeat protein [Verrucomicrobia bacterium]|nr:tetratricopeptide repeat protein [Verrucomicrobiota bacterium]
MIRKNSQTGRPGQTGRTGRTCRIGGAIMLLGATAALAAPKDKEAAWAVASAPYRVALQAGDAPGAPAAGWEIRVPDFGAGRADMRDVVLLGPDRKELALDPVWRGAGRSLLVLAEELPGDGAAATLYFGGNTQRRLRSWSAKRSLLLETRRLPPGANVATFGGWQEAWKQSRMVDGAGFVPLVFHGENPFGGSDHFLSRYTGLLQTGEGGTLRFYTLSDDVSYVMIDGRPALKWSENNPPPLAPEKVPVTAVRVPAGLVKIEYFHAAGEPPAAMVLGWEQAGKLGTVPPEAWVHPGKVTAGSIEAHDGSPVPLATLVAERYLGYGGEWYVRVTGAITNPGAGWQIEWLWPDGHLDQGPDLLRLWLGTDPVQVTLRLRNGTRLIEGRRVLVIPRNLEAASVNDERQLQAFLELLEMEDPTALPEAARRAGFVLASAFLQAAAAARWAEAWLAVAKPGAAPWPAAMAMAIRETARRDPQAALDRLSGLAKPARNAMGRTAELLELDLRVFDLKDPLVLALAARLRKSGDKTLAATAVIRLGDYHLLTGRLDEAARCFNEAVPDREAAERKAPVIDRTHSLAIEELINGRHLEEARAKLDEWERQRPAAKLGGDQLLWRARVLFLAEDYQRALQDLETCLKVRPGSPEEIDVRFWQGRTLFELGRKDEARKIWNSLVKDYPKHERAEAAKLWTAKP